MTCWDAQTVNSGRFQSSEYARSRLVPNPKSTATYRQTQGSVSKAKETKSREAITCLASTIKEVKVSGKARGVWGRKSLEDSQTWIEIHINAKRRRGLSNSELGKSLEKFPKVTMELEGPAPTEPVTLEGLWNGLHMSLSFLVLPH